MSVFHRSFSTMAWKKSPSSGLRLIKGSGHAEVVTRKALPRGKRCPALPSNDSRACERAYLGTEMRSSDDSGMTNGRKDKD